MRGAVYSIMNHVVSAGAIAWVLCSWGCTGLEPAAISAGASAAQSGVTFFSRGKLRSFELVTFEDALEAVRRAGARLSMRLVEEEIRDAGAPAASGDAVAATPEDQHVADRTGADVSSGRARLVFHDERGGSVVVVIERRTATVTFIQADVGLLGDTGLSSLLLMETYDELREMEAYIDDPRRVRKADAGGGESGEE